MTKKTDINTLEIENTTTENLEIREFTLSNGTKVTMTEPHTEEVLMARELAGKRVVLSYAYLIAECTLFNGQKLTANDIRNMRAKDYLLLEGNISELSGEKN